MAHRILQFSTPWALFFFGMLEVSARWVTRPEHLQDLRSYGPDTCFLKAKKLTAENPAAALVVGGDSTGERGIDACLLGDRLKQKGLNVAIAGGTVNVLLQLLDLQRRSGGHASRVLLMASSFNHDTSSPSFSFDFEESAQNLGFANALVGKAIALYGSRDALHRVFEAKNGHATFENYISQHDACGLAVPNPAPKREEFAAQLKQYEGIWGFSTVAPNMEKREARLAEAIRGARSGVDEMTIVMSPYRSDVVPYIEARWPGDLRRLQNSWVKIATQANVRLLNCTQASADDSHFYDPFHLTAQGRAFFSSCLAEQLTGGRACCEELVSAHPAGRM